MGHLIQSQLRERPFRNGEKRVFATPAKKKKNREKSSKGEACRKGSTLEKLRKKLGQRCSFVPENCPDMHQTGRKNC